MEEMGHHLGDCSERNVDREAVVAGMLDDISFFAERISDGRKLNYEARPFETGMEVAYRYCGSRVTMGVAITWNPHSGDFEVGLNSRSGFLVVAVKIPHSLDAVYDALLRLTEAEARRR